MGVRNNNTVLKGYIFLFTSFLIYHYFWVIFFLLLFVHKWVFVHCFVGVRVFVYVYVWGEHLYVYMLCLYIHWWTHSCWFSPFPMFPRDWTQVLSLVADAYTWQAPSGCKFLFLRSFTYKHAEAQVTKSPFSVEHWGLSPWGRAFLGLAHSMYPFKYFHSTSTRICSPHTVWDLQLLTFNEAKYLSMAHLFLLCEMPVHVSLFIC